jgi:hypothetical protein
MEKRSVYIPVLPKPVIHRLGMLFKIKTPKKSRIYYLMMSHYRYEFDQSVSPCNLIPWKFNYRRDVGAPVLGADGFIVWGSKRAALICHSLTIPIAVFGCVVAKLFRTNHQSDVTWRSGFLAIVWLMKIYGNHREYPSTFGYGQTQRPWLFGMPVKK